MRLRNVKNAGLIIDESPYIIKDPMQYKGHFNTLFNNDHPLNIEIGMGKGDFIMAMAIKYPEINFIGLEKYESVLVRAIQKLEGQKIPNLRLICADAIEIDAIFDHEITTLYLNFSDPWPKKRHAKRRLTSPIFLSKYANIFKDINEIIMKTDNIELYAYSLESLSQDHYYFQEASLDYQDEDNVLTEYESKFRKQNIRINYLHAIKDVKR